MSDTIRRHLHALVVLCPHDDDDGSAFYEAYLSHLADIETEADAIAADLARVVAYARELEDYYTSDYSSTTESVEALRARIRAEHGVADLMRDNDGEAR